MCIRATTATVALLLTLTACGGDSSTPSAEPSGTPSAGKEDRFLTAVNRAEIKSWIKEAPTDEELLRYPKQWCAALDEGRSVKYLFSPGGGGLYPVGLDWMTKKPDANRVLVLGVTVYCPEHRDRVRREIRDGA